LAKTGVFVLPRLLLETRGNNQLTQISKLSRAIGLGGSMNEAKVIKRYQNRKLYDTHESSYVTLDEIAKMIRAGEEIRVIDNKTKNDITAATLTQLLYESERKAKTQPSVNLLKTIIRSGDGSFSGFIQDKMKTELASIEAEAAAAIAANSSSANVAAAPVMNQ
jgi:polyhydroxyalkanoate synthesis repressor PhaR